MRRALAHGSREARAHTRARRNDSTCSVPLFALRLKGRSQIPNSRRGANPYPYRACVAHRCHGGRLAGEPPTSVLVLPVLEGAECDFCRFGAEYAFFSRRRSRRVHVSRPTAARRYLFRRQPTNRGESFGTPRELRARGPHSTRTRAGHRRSGRFRRRQ
jgi:hypothetical protein